MKHYMTDVITIIIMFLFINAAQTYFHETIHSNICDEFGGKSQIDYSIFMQGGKTECTTNEGLSYHIINDIISYTTSVLIITIFMCLIFITTLLEKRRILDCRQTIHHR